MAKKPTMLMILDGFGKAPDGEGNAISKAETPALDAIFANYPDTTISASGLAIGLPDGQMGNSEVGHLNIGAGRIVYQELTRITNEIETGSFFENEALITAMDHAKENNSNLHIWGLLSDGGVHSHISHLKGIIKMAHDRGLDSVCVHGFLDGRDVPPRCAGRYIDEIEEYMNELGTGKLELISGRYYAMDRDKRWDRLELAYDALTRVDGFKAGTASEALKMAYERDENDEFVKPTVIGDFTPVSDNDSIIMYNFRPDRAREITRSFVDPEFDGFERKVTLENLCYVCMTQYDATIPNVLIAYPPERLENTLGEYLSSLGLKQLRIAETE